MIKEKIPALVIPRLSLYYRALLESRKTDIISSEELANLIGVTAAQVRRDLTYFGQFGTTGKGYQINELRTRILSSMVLANCLIVIPEGVTKVKKGKTVTVQVLD